MNQRTYAVLLRMRPFVLSALTLILAACNQGGSSGAGGPGY